MLDKITAAILVIVGLFALWVASIPVEYHNCEVFDQNDDGSFVYLCDEGILQQ